MAGLWELRIARKGEQIRASNRRTVGTYEVFHNGTRVAGLEGATAESRLPGDNAVQGNKRCIEDGVYKLYDQSGVEYTTIGYTANVNPAALRRPGLLLLPTGARVGILIHPARGFLWSVGCINLATALLTESNDIDFLDSRSRVIALIDDLRAFYGTEFPTQGGGRIDGATVRISSN